MTNSGVVLGGERPFAREGLRAETPELWWQRLGRWFFLLLVCAYFGLSYASLPSFLKMRLYTAGGERVPYQFRVLPMWIFRGLTHIPLVMRVGEHTQALRDDPYQVMLAGLALVSLLLAMLATAATITWFTGSRQYGFWMAFLVAGMVQLDLAYAWDGPFTTPYDMPSVMFFCIAIYLVLRRRWWAYYPVFVLAVFNRETACFITVFFAVWEWFGLESAGVAVPARLRWIAPQVVLQAALWAAIKYGLSVAFRGNPVEGGGYVGGLFITHFGYNLRELVNVAQWPLLVSVAGFSLPFVWLQRRWIGSRGLAWSIGVIVPLSFALLMIVGVITEIRIFADWIALVAPAVALIVWNRFGPGAIETRLRVAS